MTTELLKVFNQSGLINEGFLHVNINFVRLIKTDEAGKPVEVAFMASWVMTVYDYVSIIQIKCVTTFNSDEMYTIVLHEFGYLSHSNILLHPDDREYGSFTAKEILVDASPD